ncbi:MULTISPECIES: ATP-binding protein [unclassified Thermosipho (in: thermotogales)]|uniref:ATP-binding protein n=1 Tax=unclassified Thermosipho (in: thermotogales) TaxID=2676525 RepID=UPI0009853E9B|nr:MULTISPECIES: ATP-binding protein [unclassified Thermosipho (in: thermotogales)]MBT1247030.1 hypothetical protein [Thermosipho sp. 1244]
MKIKKLILENFRIFKDRIVIDFEDLTVFIGKNDIGKTTILDALDIFFNGKDAQVKLDKKDINKDSSSNEILIGAVFEDYPQTLIIDTNVETSLEEEFLLNKEGLLEIRKKCSGGDMKKEKIYIVANHPTHENLKDLLILKTSDLKQRAKELGVDLSNEDKRVASKIRKAIRYKFNKEELRLEEIEIPIDKEGTKQIWEQLKNYLPLYTLFKVDRQNADQDAEIQDPMRIAIKKIMSNDEIRNRLREIEKKVEEEITKIAVRTIEKLKEMNSEIAQKLKPRIPEPKWENVFKGMTISSDGGIPFNKRGSGVRRLILLGFLRAEAEEKKEERNVPNVIYAFEEPETSQHPDHQKKLVEAFLALSGKDDTQVILTTHSPRIANLLSVKSLRFLHKENEKVIIEEGSDNVFEKAAESLGVLPSIDADKFDRLKAIVCVEGPTDVEFFKRVGKIIDKDLQVDLSLFQK